MGNKLWSVEIHNGMGKFKDLNTRVVDETGKEVCDCLNRWSNDHGVANAKKIVDAVNGYTGYIDLAMFKGNN